MGRMKFVLLATLALVGSGCASRMTFSESMRSANALDRPGMRGAQLNDLQYFVSNRVLLRRKVKSGNGAVRRGKLMVRKGKLVEEVVVRRNTPGVVVDSGPGWIAVSFAKGTAFVFEHEDDPTRGTETGVYRLRQRHRDGHNLVEFGGTEYRVLGAGRWASLQVKRRVRERYSWRRNVLQGRRLE